jgi:hypothetical protein
MLDLQMRRRLLLLGPAGGDLSVFRKSRSVHELGSISTFSCNYTHLIQSRSNGLRSAGAREDSVWNPPM